MPAQGACLGCSTRAVISGRSLRMQPRAVSPGRELEALSGCSSGCTLGALSQSWGAVAGPSAGLGAHACPFPGGWLFVSGNGFGMWPFLPEPGLSRRACAGAHEGEQGRATGGHRD